MPDIRNSLIIGAPVEKVYEVITTREGLSGWWTPDIQTENKIATHSRFHFGPEYFKEMLITELVPDKQVSWECIKGDLEWIGTSISFSLKSGDKNLLSQTNPEIEGQLQQTASEKLTLLTFAHDNWGDYTPMFAECNYTWGRFLRSLKLLCETGKGLPWPHQHSV